MMMSAGILSKPTRTIKTQRRTINNRRDETILEKAQFGLSNAVIDVELADLAIKYATITTPIAGLVTHIDHSLRRE